MNAVATSTHQTFSFHDHQIRVVIRDGEPWFVASDAARVLGYRDAANAARYLPEKQRGTLNGSTPLTLVSEGGLYRLVLRSRKPEAEAFTDWVTDEVLPSIRKTGSYQHPDCHPTVLRDVPVGYVLVEEALIHDLQKGADLVINLRALLEGLSKLADSKGTDFLGGMTMLLDGVGMRASADRVRQANFRHCGRPAGTALQP